MNTKYEQKFYELYEKLASATANINQKPDIPLIESLLGEISAMFRLSKGITHFYRSPIDEQNEKGETMVSYDLRKQDKPVHTVRFVTRLMSITTMTVYMAEDEPPLTEDELSKVDLTMRTTLAYISRNRLQDIAEELAFFDDVGYRNLRSFYHYLSWKCPPEGFSGMSAVNYNLRHFSLINQELGRSTGDSVIRNHYQYVEKLIGTNGTLSRLGGDSFVCICEQSVLPELLNYLTEAVVPYNTNGDTVTISACAGVFNMPERYQFHQGSDVMEKIVPACRLAQDGRQGNIIFYDEKLVTAKEKTMRVQQQFPKALKNHEFQVFYQPKVNTMTGELCGAEALCRWFRNGKLVPPMEFIPVLEQTNDICKLDFYMLEMVCQHIRKWLDEGRKVVRVSVNLSRKHMMDSRLLETIIDIISRYQVPHEYIEIELTETTTDVEFKDLQRIVGGLQEQSIYTAVDDFGMGYSSLNLIRVIPWNVLKVDRSFLPLDDEQENSVRNIMFRYVVAMAKEMGLECIVEGVETPVQLEVLRKNHCELAQGFLFDKPLPLDEFEKRLDMQVYPIEMKTAS